MLLPENEAGCQKFISSFIRPTSQSVLELFDYKHCILRISNYIYFLELENNKQYPSTIISPFNTCRLQEGDPIDISVFAASLLIGIGYDAFVVCGDASMELVKKNECNQLF